jgi:hypothetical protein
MTSPNPEESDTRKFTSNVVEDLLQRNLKGGYKPPCDAGYHRLADAFNRIYEREIFGEVYDSPHMFWRHGIGGRADISINHGKRELRRWPNFVRELAETIQTELTRANRTPIGLSDDGPVARVTVEVIFMITGEKPSGASVVREVQRQQRKA